MGETWWKRFVLRNDVEGISCVPPALYRKRFMKYMRSIIISDHQYYRELNLQKDQFGDEKVMIYPPRKVMRQSMYEMQKRRRSHFASVDSQHAVSMTRTVSNEDQEERFKMKF